MKIAILQPGYLPWLGFFDQMAQCDRFVIYDDVQFTRRDWRSRNRIRSLHSPEGWQWLTVPVRNSGNYHAAINEIEIDHATDWPRKHLGAISASYGKAPFFQDYFPVLETILRSRPERLVDLDLALIRQCADWLGIDTPLSLSSELNVPGTSTDRLVAICRHFEADRYLTGQAARAYLDEARFAAADIAVEWHEYTHPIYPQIGNTFVPFMSVIDLLFQCGPDSRNRLR